MSDITVWTDGSGFSIKRQTRHSRFMTESNFIQPHSPIFQLDKGRGNSMSPKLLGASIAYLVAGSIFIEVLSKWMPFKAAFGIGMILCFLIALLANLKSGAIAVLSALFCLLVYVDNSLSLYWISDVKQYDWVAIIGSGILFALPGLFARLLKIANQKLNGRPKKIPP